MFSKDEIDHKIRNGQLERLKLRLKKMRKQLLDRDWNGIRLEVQHVREGSIHFQNEDLHQEVQKVLTVLDHRPFSKTALDPKAKESLEILFQKIDRFLNQNQISQ